MTNATKARGQKAAAKPKPEPEPAEELAEAPSDEVLDAEDAAAAYLNPDEDLGTAEFETIDRLPHSGKRVEVRRLYADEVMQLQFLPSLGGFQEVMIRLEAERLRVQKLRDEGKDAEADAAENPDPASARAETAEIEKENYRWMVHVAHAAVRPPGAPPVEDPKRCAECHLEHRPAFLSIGQAKRLRPADIRAISAVALPTARLEAVAPFSVDEMPLDSAEPSDSGPAPETQPTN